MNFQKPILLCALLVTVAAAPTKPGADLSQKKRFESFGKFLNDSTKAVEQYSMIHLLDTSDEFQGICLQSFEKKMQLSTLDYNSEKVDKLEVLALQTFEDTVVKTIRGFQRLVQKRTDLLYLLEWILERGDVLHFLSYLNNLEIPEKDLKNEMRKLQKSPEGFTEVEARWVVILNKYNKGKIRNDYPKPCGGGGLKRMMSRCISM